MKTVLSLMAAGPNSIVFFTFLLLLLLPAISGLCRYRRNLPTDSIIAANGTSFLVGGALALLAIIYSGDSLLRPDEIIVISFYGIFIILIAGLLTTGLTVLVNRYFVFKERPAELIGLTALIAIFNFSWTESYECLTYSLILGITIYSLDLMARALLTSWKEKVRDYFSEMAQ